MKKGNQISKKSYWNLHIVNLLTVLCLGIYNDSELLKSIRSDQ